MHGAAPVKAFERFMSLAELFQNCAFDDFVYPCDTQNPLVRVEGLLTTTETHR